MGDLPYLDLVANGHKFFLTQQTLEGLPHLPGLENGPGFDSQGSVNFFTKYCFPNLHRIHVKAFEVEDCEFVPVHHQQKLILEMLWYDYRIENVNTEYSSALKTMATSPPRPTRPS